jgi:arsenite methyltransferase
MLNERGVMQSADRLAAVGGVMIWAGLGFFLIGCLLLLARKAGKLILREGILNSISWRGDEQVLDVGCGRGQLLVGAAKRLQTGRAVGVDVWPPPQPDHNHNGTEAVLEQARVAGVAERVELKTADFQELPLADASIDVILSSLAIQSIADPTGREAAIREMARVLKPGGQLVVADTRYTQEYEQLLHSLGWERTQCLSPGPSFVTPARVLRAVKP